MTKTEILKMLQTREGKEKLSKILAKIWYDKWDQKKCYNFSSFNFSHLEKHTDNETWLKYAEEADLLEKLLVNKESEE